MAQPTLVVVSDFDPFVLRPSEVTLLSPGTPLYAIYDCAAALERAEASARVLGARAAGCAGAPRAFARLAIVAPDGLVPSPGRGAAHVARQIEQAADTVVQAESAVGDEVVDAMQWVAGMIGRIAATSDALDTAGVARAARRAVATVRGLVAETLPRDERWDAFRLGTHLPRAAWITALLRATDRVSREFASPEAWSIAAELAQAPDRGPQAAVSILTDRALVTSVAHCLGQTEATLLGLVRHGRMNTAHVALARDANSLARSAAAQATSNEDLLAEALDLLLETIGALVASVDPRVGAGRQHQPQMQLRTQPA